MSRPIQITLSIFLLFAMIASAYAGGASGSGSGLGEVRYGNNQRLSVTNVTNNDMRSESKKLLKRLFEQANKDYKLYKPADWIALLTDISTLVGSFDSKFHNLENNQQFFKYRDKTLTGTDLISTHKG